MHSLLKPNQTVVILEYKTLQDQYSQSCKYQKTWALLKAFSRTYEKTLSSSPSSDLFPFLYVLRNIHWTLNLSMEKMVFQYPAGSTIRNLVFSGICPQPASDRELETALCSHRELSLEINYLWHNTIESVSEVNP